MIADKPAERDQVAIHRFFAPNDPGVALVSDSASPLLRERHLEHRPFTITHRYVTTLIASDSARPETLAGGHVRRCPYDRSGDRHPYARGEGQSFSRLDGRQALRPPSMANVCEVIIALSSAAR